MPSCLIVWVVALGRSSSLKHHRILAFTQQRKTQLSWATLMDHKSQRGKEMKQKYDQLPHTHLSTIWLSVYTTPLFASLYVWEIETGQPNFPSDTCESVHRSWTSPTMVSPLPSWIGYLGSDIEEDALNRLFFLQWHGVCWSMDEQLLAGEFLSIKVRQS